MDKSLQVSETQVSPWICEARKRRESGQRLDSFVICPSRDICYDPGWPASGEGNYVSSWALLVVGKPRETRGRQGPQVAR